MQQLAHLYPTREGIALAGVMLIKRNPNGRFDVEGREQEIHAQLQAAYGKMVPPRSMRYVRRGCELLASVSAERLEEAAYPFHPNPYATLTHGNHFSDLVKGLMMFALSGLGDMENIPEGKDRLLKMQASHHRDALLKSYGLPIWAELTKDDDEGEEDDGEDDSGDGNDDEDSDFDSKHPRWPAGSPDSTGGEFRPKDSDTSGTGFGGYDASHNIDNVFVQAFLTANQQPSPPPQQGYVPQFDAAGNPQEGAEASYPLENLVAFLGAGEVLAALRGTATTAPVVAPAADSAVSDAANAVREYIGADAKMIVNEDGDLILMNDTQKIRFDINDPHGYDPHFHIEEWNGSKWVDAGDHMYYFKDK